MEHKSYASLTNDGERILAQNITVSNNSWKTGRNNNDLIIGPTGSGKTRYYVKPNLLNASDESAGQSVPHFHIHIIPRKSGDGVDAWPKFDGTNHEMEELFQKLRIR